MDSMRPAECGIYFSNSCVFDKSVLQGLCFETDKGKTHSGKVYDRVVNGLIPRTRREKSYFVATALAAGICEEIVFRGFLLYVLIRIFPELSPFLLAALAGACFGAAHFYQGIKGVIKTGLLGILFGFLYISTGSLYLCMAVHFLFDISAAFLCEEDKYEV